MLKLKVVTPDKVLIDEIVDNVSIPTSTGVITVLNKHVPIISTIRAGEMTIRKDGVGVGYAVFKGLVNVRAHKNDLTEVVLLLERGERADELDRVRAEQALKRAEELKNEMVEDLEFGKFESMIEKELNRIKISNKYRG